MRNSILFILGVFCFASVFAQNKVQKKQSDNFIYQGNQKLLEKDYTQAEASYRNSISITPDNATAAYNLGNSLYQNKLNAEAFYQYKSAAKKSVTKEEKHRAFHNMGNTFMNTQEYDKAVVSYKDALRNNPNDEETRYNYALAKELLKKQQEDQKNKDQNKDNKDSDKDDKKDQDKDQKNQDNKKEEGEENQDKENKEDADEKTDKEEKDKSKDEKPNEKDNKNEPPPTSQISPQQLKNLLEAMTNEEKNVQEKVNAQKVKGAPIKAKKDW